MITRFFFEGQIGRFWFKYIGAEWAFLAFVFVLAFVLLRLFSTEKRCADLKAELGVLSKMLTALIKGTDEREQ